MHTRLKIFALPIFLSILLIPCISPIRGDHGPLKFVAYTPLESASAPTLALIFKDLGYAKQLGFNGIKLWDTNGLADKSWLGPTLNYAAQLGLKVNVVYSFDGANFPPTPESVNLTKQSAVRIASITASSEAVAWNNLFAPFDWNVPQGKRATIVQSSQYRDALQTLVAVIKSSDPFHEVRVSFDGDPTIGFPFLNNVDGYGVMPYSPDVDSIDLARLDEYVGYFADARKPVYIDEWGLQTTGAVAQGRASTEQEKSRLLVEFVKIVDSLSMDWTYFMLVDRVPTIKFEQGADWGLFNVDRTSRLSASCLQTFLMEK